MDSTRPRASRIVAAGAGLLTSALLLSGCGSIIDSITGPSEAQRDEPGGEVTAASDADVFSLQLGDCVDQPTGGEEDAEVTSLPVVPCSDPHTDELYAEKELDAGDYPGDETISLLTDEFCTAEFDLFVGLAYADSSLDYRPMLPTQEGWELYDDRVIQCFITAGPEPSTGTLKGAGI